MHLRQRHLGRLPGRDRARWARRDRNEANGELTQKTGTAGCVSADGSGGACRTGVAFDGANGVTISPDGGSVYVSSYISDAVTILDRDTTGALSQKPGASGCISQDGSGGACQDGEAMVNAGELVVSPDGKSVYVASGASYAVAIFDRNLATGGLTQKAGTAGCISEGASGCQAGRGLVFVRDIAVSPDGTSVYTAAESDAVAVFDRNPSTGELAQKAGFAGCITETGAGGCTDGKALDGALGVTVSPDGRMVLIASYASNAVGILDRNPATGELVQRAGNAGCISDLATGEPACGGGRALDGTAGVAISGDGSSVYVSAARADAVATFDRAGPAWAVVPPADTTSPGTIISRARKRVKTGKIRAKVSFGFYSTEPASTFECRLDGRTFRSCVPPKRLRAKVGKHRFAVRAIDAAGNIDPTPAIRRFRVIDRRARRR